MISISNNHGQEEVVYMAEEAKWNTYHATSAENLLNTSFSIAKRHPASFRFCLKRDPARLVNHSARDFV